MKRVMCVWLPGWPIQRLRAARREPSQQPLALFAPAGRGKMAVVACSVSAAQYGITPGMPLAEARALAGLGTSIRFELHDPGGDAEALRALAVWCQRQLSPRVAVEDAESPETLLLDTAGCSHLFGGEEAHVRKTAEAFSRRGYAVRIAVADTIGAAWALAHFGGAVSRDAESHFAVSRDAESSERSASASAHAEALQPLPVEALRLSSDDLQLLREFDIRQIGQLLALPRADLAARFSLELTRRLDQALGNVPEPLVFEYGDETVEACWEFEFPTADRRMVEAVFEQLLEQVLARLERRRLGVQKFRCSLRTTAGQPLEVEVGLLQPSASLSYLMELLRLHFERLVLLPRRGRQTEGEGEVSVIAVRVLAAAPLEFCQGELFSACRKRQQQFPALIERLSNRLGEKSVLRPRLWPDAQPEFACRYEEWSLARATRHSPLTTHQTTPRPSSLAPRPSPLAVMSVIPGGPPLRFQWQGQDHIVAQCWGPERIETGWWRDRDVRRDYYLVETTAGKRFWLFRTRGDERWFLHGSFA
jgi:protein ImuB